MRSAIPTRWISTLGLTLLCFTFSCSSEFEPTQVSHARLRFHVDTSSEATAHLSVSEVNGNGYQVEVDFEAPGVVDLPLPAGNFATRIKLGENSTFKQIVLEDGMELDLHLQFVLTVVRTQLPEIFVGEAVDLELQSARRRFQSQPVEVPSHGQVEWTFPHVLAGQYAPHLGQMYRSCPGDSLDLQMDGIVVADLVSPGQISWEVNAPWAPTAMDSVRVEIYSFPDRSVAFDWKQATAHIEAELPCGTAALLALPPQHGIQVQENGWTVSTAGESDPSTWNLGGLELELITTNSRDSFELGIGPHRSFPMVGSIQKQWLLNPGTYELAYIPSRPGLMPPQQSFRPDPENPEIRRIDLRALASISVVWTPLEGGTVSGEFLDPFEEGDELGIRSSARSFEWAFELQDDRRHFEIHHVPMDDFQLRRSRVVDGRSEAWWYPGTTSSSEAVDLHVEDGAVLSGVIF